MIRIYEVKFREPYGGTEMKMWIEITLDTAGNIVRVELVDRDGTSYFAQPFNN